MKKLTVFALVLCLVLGLLAGCGETKTPAAPAETATPAAEPAAEAPAAEAPAAEAPAAEPAATEAAAEPEVVEEPVELIVFAAASMTEAMNNIKETYEAEHNVILIFSFAGSNDLVKQIKEGAPCDVFISAGQKQMNQIDITASAEVNTDGSDLVLQGSRFNLLENKVALAVPVGNPAGITGFEDMMNRLKEGTIFMAVAAENVPVRNYTDKIFAYYGNSVAEYESLMTICADVKGVTSLVKDSAVDCGIIYQTDAWSAGLEIVDGATAEMCGQVIYPAAALNTSEHPEAAAEFLEYLKSAEASAALSAIGFSPLN